jgi:hypothetical protein
MAAASPIRAAATPAAVAAQVSTQTVDMASLDNARAPTRVDMAQVRSRPLAAQSAAAAAPSAANINTVQTFEVNPADLLAPTVDLSGPTEVRVGVPVQIDAPTAFADYAELSRRNYAEAASISTPSAVGVDAASFGGAAIETDVSGSYLGAGGDPSGPAGTVGGVPGGTGSGPPSVPCLQSAYVDRYLQIVKKRTEARWVLPADAAPDEQVILRFNLDFAGAATDIRVYEASTQTFGSSAHEALHRASPFPPLDDNVRCLIEKTIKLTFRHPAT